MTDYQLRKASMLFRSFGSPALVNTGPKLVSWALGMHLPVKPIIRHTLFEQFCGGENIEDCLSRIDDMGQFGIGTILDYTVEGEKSELGFETTAKEISRTIEAASKNQHIPFSVFKPTGLIRFELLEKLNADVAAVFLRSSAESNP